MATYTWNSPNGYFATATNWLVGGVSNGTVPGSADTAEVDGGTIDGIGTVATLDFGATDIVTGSLTSLANINESGGFLVVAGGGTLAAAYFFQISDASDLALEPGAVMTLAGTIVGSGQGAYPAAMYVSSIATFDGSMVNGSGQINIGSATRASSVTAEAGASARFWATNVGDAEGEAASLLLAGAGTTWSNSGGAGNFGGYLDVGSGYPNSVGTSGTVTITSGALLANAGDATVGVGAGASGTLVISAGGRMTSAGSADQIASDAGSTGSALVDGAGSSWSAAGQIDVGASGAATLQVSDSGLVQAGAGIIVGDDAGSVGSLLVTSGGVVTSTGNTAAGVPGLSLGATSTGSGAATVTGAGSAIQLSGGLAVGGAGVLDILTGGVVSVSGGTDVLAAGRVSLAGGAFDTDGLTVAAGSGLGGNGIVSGNVTDSGTITAAGGTLELTGAVSGSGTFVITPGATLRLDGAVQPGSTIEFASGGTGTLAELNASLVQATIIGQQPGDVIGLPSSVDTIQGGGGAPIQIDFGSTALAVLAAPLLAGTRPASTLFITAPGNYAMTAPTTAAIDTSTGAVTLTGGNVANETIAAGPGAFEFQGGAGSSGTVVAGAGADSIYLPGGGNWSTYLGNGADTVVAATGNDTIATGTGGSFVFLGSGASSVASAGADTILGATGAATVAAVGANSDELFSLGGPLTFIAGTGASTVVSGAVPATLYGGSAGGTLMFGDGATQYTGSGATDTVVGLAGSMTVQGGAGGGLYFGGTAGGNIITAGAGNVTAFGGGNGDVLTATGSAADLFAGGGAGPETLIGGAGNTALVAGAGSDLLEGGSGLTLFQFVAGRTAGGSDTISGFNPTHDFIGLSGYSGSEASVVANAAVVGGSSVIALSDGTHITFAGVTSLNLASFT